jgi:hypothetical protein
MTTQKPTFPSNTAVLKNLYLAALELEKKWDRSVIKDWGIYLRAAINNFRREVRGMIEFTQFYGYSPLGILSEVLIFRS